MRPSLTLSLGSLAGSLAGLAVAGFAPSSASGQAAPQPADPGFETPDITDTFAYNDEVVGPPTFNDADSPWDFTGGTGLTDPPSGFSATAAPEGSQYAFLQGGPGSIINQNVSGFTVGATYQVQYMSAARNCCTNPSVSNPITVSLGGTRLGTFADPTLETFTPHTSRPFTATGGSLTLQFEGRGVAGGDVTSFLDAVRIVPGSPVNFVTNGDFETAANTFTVFPGYTGQAGNPAEVPGYTATGTGNNGVNPTTDGSQPFAPNGPVDGHFGFMQVSTVAVTAPVTETLSQTITGLTAGQQYILYYDDASRANDAGDTATLTVSIDGATQTTVPTSNSFLTRTLTFTATDDTATLTFLASNSATESDQTIALDNILLQPVPEPAAFGLLALGGLGVLARRRRV